jgi:hypothetical protein
MPFSLGLGLQALWENLDGRKNAPAGVAPQLPLLFSTYGAYATRPPWYVAGVDYGVGPHQGTVFQDPTTAPLPNGASFNSAGRYIRANNSGTVFDGWDFGGATIGDGGGYQIYIGPGVDGTVIRNCKFKRGAALTTNGNFTLIQNQGGSLTVEYCELDDGQSTSSVADAPIYCAFGSSSSSAFLLTMHYNFIHDIACGHPWDSSIPVIDKYNLYSNLGFAATAHGNGGLFVGSNTAGQPAIIPNSVLQFRTLVGGPAAQVGGVPTGLCEAFQAASNNYETLIGTDIGYNVAISPSYSTACYMAHVLNDLGTAGPNVNTGTKIHDNYFDPSGAIAWLYFGADETINQSFFNNINLVTGAVNPNNPANFSPYQFSFSHTSIADGFLVGQVTASNSPTLWLVTGPIAWTSSNGALGPPGTYFAIDNSGNITINATGAANLVAGNYNILVAAANSGGFFSQNIFITIT